jgi:DnaJ family protein A protein 2
MFLNMI